ncbi:hypothetical protein [Streptomyces sp. BK239]|uniref:hypothetical protein n=1 Tax=Streptomyces sp. BK239 TaxID=2512155 RepID=UPI00102C7467|nr:hypothetical protein [Streptomyces sp. BK239]
MVRHDVTTTAARVASRLEAYDLPFAQDAINAALGSPARAKVDHYRLTKVDVLLSLSAASREILAQRQADNERVRRLRFLKQHLYDDPALVVLDRMEHHPERLKSDEVEYIQRLARSLQANESWWRPLFEQWQALGEGFSDTEMQHRAMRALRKSLEELKER